MNMALAFAQNEILRLYTFLRLSIYKDVSLLLWSLRTSNRRFEAHHGQRVLFERCGVASTCMHRGVLFQLEPILSWSNL